MLLDPSRREAFWKTLNDDANALVREIGESSPEMRKLREELANCNQIFLSLSASAMEHGKVFLDLKFFFLNQQTLKRILQVPFMFAFYFSIHFKWRCFCYL